MDAQDRKVKRLFMLALVLSLGLHAIGGALLLHMVPPEHKPLAGTAKAPRQLKIVRPKAEADKGASTPTPEREEKPLDFVKTSAETPEERPKEPDYIGSRDTTLSGEEQSVGQQSEAEAPSLAGEDREELNTVNQEKQEGDLEFDGLKSSKATPTPPATLIADTAPAQASSAPPPSPVAQQREDEPTNEEAKEAQSPQAQAVPTEQQSEARATKTLAPLESSPMGDILLQQINFAPEESPSVDQVIRDIPPPAPELPASQRGAPQASAPQKAYDPMFTPEAQPGFRTKEKRSRSTGRFIIGRNAALNVAATPLGRYQELIYRRIAYFWYAMVEDKRGDIIPGSLTIRLLINHKGQITSMELVSRSGASISQQSITFAAIRKASIPAMPLAVQEGIVGDKLDLIFTFYFD